MSNKKKVENNIKTIFPSKISCQRYSKISKDYQKVLQNYYSPNLTSVKKLGESNGYFVMNPFNYEANKKLLKTIKTKIEVDLEQAYVLMEKSPKNEGNIMIDALNSDLECNLHRRSLNNLFIDSPQLFDTLLLSDISRLDISDDFMNSVISQLDYEECKYSEFKIYSFLGRALLRTELSNGLNKLNVNASFIDNLNIIGSTDLVHDKFGISDDIKTRFRTGMIHIPTERGNTSIAWIIVSHIKSGEEKERGFSVYVQDPDLGASGFIRGMDNHNSVLLETIDAESKKKVDEFVTNNSNKSTKLQDIGERFGKASTESCYLLKQLFFNVLIYRNSQTDYVKNGIPLKESVSWLKHNSYLAENPDFIITPGSEKCAHYRCGSFRYCGSDYYVNMKGKFVWVKPTYVHREIIVGNRNLDSCNTIEDKAINS